MHILITNSGGRQLVKYYQLLMSPLISCVVEVKSGVEGFMIKMRDGRHLRCVHNNPQGGHLPDYAPHPAIVLKMEDGTGLLLPIIVCMCISLFAFNSFYDKWTFVVKFSFDSF